MDGRAEEPCRARSAPGGGRAQRHPGGELDPWGREIDETTVLILTEWSYAGTGYQAADAHRLALMSADSARSR
ncbi:MAG: hypothetical protein J2P57_24155 [Acidimicrobiaceae bacterium]|nr:hypothetical protein [Acidimicrobiaceae bacterium]